MAGNPLDYQCPTCKALVSPGFPHGCFNVSNYKSATGGAPAPASQVIAATPQEIFSETRSAVALPSVATDAPYVERDGPSLPQIVVGVVVTPAAASVANNGGTQQYAASFQMSDGQLVSVPAGAVTWVSSNTGKATIAATGLATGATGGAGTSNITATVNTPNGGVISSPAAVLTLT